MTVDLERITHPLRLAKGSHQPGSGKGCAMNVISYINGDTKISDYPECSAHPLARLVQCLNDKLADPDGYLSPENSVVVLDLGWQTVGTAATPPEVVWRWLADLLIDPAYGVVKYANRDGKAVIRRVAALCVRAAEGDVPNREEWQQVRAAAADYAGYAAAAAAGAAAYAVAAAAADYAAAACDAAYAVAFAAADYAAAGYAAATANAVADGAGAAAAGYAAYARVAGDMAEFTRWAIQHWRQLAELDNPTDIDATTLNTALQQF